LTISPSRGFSLEKEIENLKPIEKMRLQIDRDKEDIQETFISDKENVQQTFISDKACSRRQQRASELPESFLPYVAPVAEVICIMQTTNGWTSLE
jgi:hypothetical protein